MSAALALTAYPDDLLASPLRQTEATVRFRSAPGGSAPDVLVIGGPGGAGRIADRFTALVGKDLTPGAGLLSFLLAVALGAGHALAPGHGKTLIAAYLVGQRGTRRDAALIGLTVTLTHTVGVLALGVVVSIGTVLAPERLYPLFGIASGVTVVVVAAGLLRRAWARRSSPALDSYPHVHAHPPSRRVPREAGPGGTGVLVDVATQDADRRTRRPEATALTRDSGRRRRRDVVAMGLAGGMVPTPSAVLVLLAAVALGRAWFGIVLVIGYGMGMAVTLTAVGLLLVRARSTVEHRLAPGTRCSRALASLPLATATVVLAAGVFLVTRSVLQL